MKLSEKQKNELRIMIEDELKNIPNGMRKKLPKKVLEELIFRSGVQYDGGLNVELDDITLAFDLEGSLDTKSRENELRTKLNEKLGKIKFPVWTGDFLSKLDLSEISFDNVIWSLDDLGYFLQTFVENNGATISDYYFTEFVEKVYSYYFPTRKDCFVSCDGKTFKFIRKVNFANTNANINFNSAFTIFKDGNEETNISDCIMCGTDLSDSSFEVIDTASRCDFTDCGLRINLDDSNSRLRETLRTCQIDGCFINGKRVDSRVVDEDKKATLKAQSDELFAKYVSMIMDGELVPVIKARKRY